MRMNWTALASLGFNGVPRTTGSTGTGWGRGGAGAAVSGADATIGEAAMGAGILDRGNGRDGVGRPNVDDGAAR